MEGTTLPDKLVVKGLGKRLDGEYECDLAGMLSLDSPQTLTNREGHKVKVMAGVTAAQIETSLRAGDNDVLVALASIILSRHGKIFEDDLLWDAPMGSGIDFEIGEREEEDDADPPEEATSTSSEDGGPTSSRSTSENPESVPSRTGTQRSGTATMAPASLRETSGI